MATISPDKLRIAANSFRELAKFGHDMQLREALMALADEYDHEALQVDEFEAKTGAPF